MSESFGDGGFVLDTPEAIEAYRLLALRSRLKLEVRGFGFRVPTAPAVREVMRMAELPAPRSKAKLLEGYEQLLRDIGVLRGE